MLEENLGRLNYNPFQQGSINSKHYSDHEPIVAVGIAPVDTVTRKTIDKKKVEVQDLKFAIKFKWDVDVLASNPDLFLRYYNYFEAAPQTKDGKKAGVASSTVTDFMPFLNDPVYSKTFNQILAGGGDEDLDADEGGFLAEATGKVNPNEKQDLENNLNSFEDGFSDPEATDEFGGDEATADESNILAGGKNDITRKKGPEFFFYLVFKYDELYDNVAKLQSGSFGDGSNIEIIKLVSEGHTDDANVAITGRVLEKKALGFYRELLGILNANHKTIVQVVNTEAEELGLDLTEIPAQDAELDFDPTSANPVEEPLANGELDDNAPTETLEPSYQTVEDANANLRRDQIATAPSSDPEFESDKALNRFKMSSGG